MKILRAANHKRMPWKNGGGETIEIAVFPQSAGLGDFDWRVSMATVAMDGPFSIFEQIDRTLTILTGAGMALEIDGQPPVHLEPSSAPLAFAADVPVNATLVNGPITDLNVMTRRGRYVHRVERVTVEDTLTLPSPALQHMLLIRDHGLSVISVGHSIPLEAQDAVLPEGGEAVTLHGHGVVFAITLTAQ
mgnify:CR=1 FL=1